jgi:tetratricopeptide (TPR) repeat protein
MMRAAMVVMTLSLATCVMAQPQAPAAQTPSAAPTGQTGAAPAGAPPVKRPPQAKTQAEFDAYQAATANANDPAVLEKSADDFAAKFADSELRILLYRAAMHGYQAANNSDKLLAMARKILTIDPDDPEALIAVAEVLAERTRDTDLDKDQRLDEATKSAQHALQTVDTDLAIPANTPQERVDAYKGYLRSTAYSILGTVEFNRAKYPEAEADFHKSIDALPSQPDPVVVLRLALALDKENRYPDALKEAYHAVELTKEGTTEGTLARRERDRLIQLTGGIPENPSAPPPAAANPNPAAPKN